MSETYDDQLSRVRLMSEGDPTWDLSLNDQAALKAVLADRDKLRGDLAATEGALDNLRERLPLSRTRAIDDRLLAERDRYKAALEQIERLHPDYGVGRIAHEALNPPEAP